MRPLLLAAALLAVPLAQAQSLRASGPPARLAGSADAPLAHAAWSPTGALAASRPDAHGLWLVADDDLRQVAEGPTWGFEWSPDGGAILFRAAREDGLRRDHAVALLDVASGETTLLSDWRPTMPTLPRFSPNGTQALVATPDGVERHTTGLTAAALAPSTGGAFLAGPGGLVSATENGSQTVTPRTALNAAASPDRQRVAFEVYGYGLYVASADGSGVVSLGPGECPTWSPDGAWVAFMRTTDDGHHITGADLWAARADGSEIVRLTDTPELEMNPSWRPDGAALAYDDGEALYLLPLASE